MSVFEIFRAFMFILFVQGLNSRNMHTLLMATPCYFFVTYCGTVYMERGREIDMPYLSSAMSTKAQKGVYDSFGLLQCYSGTMQFIYAIMVQEMIHHFYPRGAS